MAKFESNVLNTDKIGPLLVKLTLPAFMGMFVMGLYNLVNTIFVGHYVGSLGIAALSIVFPLQILAYGFSMMVGIGGASLISRQLGTGNNSEAEKTLGNAFTVSFILYVIIAAAILPFMDFWLKLIGASEAVLPLARDYLLYIIGGCFFMIFSMCLLSLARAEGNARVGMIAMIIGAVFSIGLSALFIITLNMGVVGAGLATTISQFISMCYLLFYYLNGNSYLKFRIKNLALDFKILKDMLSIGTAAFTQAVTNSVSVMILISLISSYGGDTALSAFGIVQRIMFFAFMPSMVIGQGAQPIVGYNYGAKRYGLLLKTINIAAVASTIISTVMFLILYFIPEPLIRIFTTDVEIIETGEYVVKLLFLSMPLMGVINLGMNMFQAIGKAVQSFIAAIAKPVAFLIPLVLIMSRAWGLDGVFLSTPASDLLTFILILVMTAPLIRNFRKHAALETSGCTDHESGRMAETPEAKLSR